MEPPGFTIQVFDPLIQNAGYRGMLRRWDSYRHRIEAFGGYHSAEIGFPVSYGELEDWLTRGLGCHVVVKEASDTVWEGFVNEVRAAYGPLDIRWGALLDAANRAAVSYRGVDITVTPPLVGVQALTAWTDDAVSQERYGIIPKIFTASDAINATDVVARRDWLLSQHALPVRSKDWRKQAKADTHVTLQCLGYHHWLFYPYNQLVNVGTTNTYLKIIDVLTGTDAATGSDYNLNSGWLPFGTNYVETSTYTAGRYEYQDRQAIDVIKDCCWDGTNNERWLFGVYANREAHYSAVPDVVAYRSAINDPARRVYTVAGAEVKPWSVLPGRWIEYTDFFLQEAEFIESVQFVAPNDLQIRASTQKDVRQILSAYGITGL